MIGGTTLLAMLGLPAIAHADEPAPKTNAIADAAPADPDSDKSADDTTVVVTAQRRNQSTMDVGINVTQISAERLAADRIVRVGELINVTSNVEVREIRPGGGQPAITIRGVGQNDYTAATNPSTSVYFDGVYSPNIGTISQQMFDIQAIEVLKGPQSTLYGRNATAGAITITSALPTDALSGYVSGSFGNYKALEAEGAISGPLGEGLTGRLSVKTRQTYEGWMTNVFPGRRDIGQLHQVSLRAQLKWDASSRFSVHAIFGYQHEDDEPGAFAVYGRRVPGGSPAATTPFCPVSLAGQVDFNNSCASLFGAVRPSTDPRVISENDSWAVRGNTYTGTVITKYEADAFAITSTTGYIDWFEQYNKADGLPITEQFAVWNQKTWQLSEDLQVASTGKHPLEWLFGAYASTGAVNLPVYTIVPINGGNFISTHHANTRTVQAYGQLDFNVLSRLTLTAGARFIHEYDNKDGGTFKDVNFNHILDTGDITQAYIKDSIQQNALTWKLGINYRPSTHTLAYASVTHGFKSGGFIFAPIATNSNQLAAYKGENIYAFELGLKQSLWNDAINLTASGFYYKYKNLQTNQQQLVGNLNINRFANLPDAHLKGIDLDLLLKPVRGLELRLDGGWIDTFVGAFFSGGVNYAPGNRFANAPSFAGSASIRYERPVTPDLNIAITSSAHRQSSIFANTENTPLYRVNSDATLVNAQLQVILPKAGWTAALWGKNLTDESYSNSTFQNGSTVIMLLNTPRTDGVSVSKRF